MPAATAPGHAESRLREHNQRPDEALKRRTPSPEAAHQPPRLQSAAAARSDSDLQHPQEALHLSHSGETANEEYVKTLGAVAGGRQLTGGGKP